MRLAVIIIARSLIKPPRSVYDFCKAAAEFKPRMTVAPRIALERSDSGEVRIEKIIELTEQSK